MVWYSGSNGSMGCIESIRRGNHCGYISVLGCGVDLWLHVYVLMFMKLTENNSVNDI